MLKINLLKLDASSENHYIPKIQGARAETLLQLATQKNQKYLLFFFGFTLLGGIVFIINYYKAKIE
jgi:hypothetical protein